MTQSGLPGRRPHKPVATTQRPPSGRGNAELGCRCGGGNFSVWWDFQLTEL